MKKPKKYRVGLFSMWVLICFGLHTTTIPFISSMASGIFFVSMAYLFLSPYAMICSDPYLNSEGRLVRKCRYRAWDDPEDYKEGAKP